MRCETGEFPIKIIQGDSYRRVYKFYDTDGNVMDNSSISSVVLSVSRLNYTQTLNWNAAEEGYVFILSADTTAEFPYCKGTYDITLNFRDTQVSTQVYQSSWQIFEKDVFYNTITNNKGYMTCENSEVVIKTGITVSAGGAGGTDDHSQLINRNLPNQHPMSAITGLEDALEGKQPSGDYATTQELDELAEIVEGKADSGDIPTKTSELENDSDFTTKTYVDDADTVLQGQIDDLQAEKMPLTEIDTVPTDGSTNLVESGGVYDAIDAVQQDVDDIEAVISTQATPTNKLVSASEMGDAISAVEAKQLYATSSQGSFATKAQLLSATTFYNADGTVATPTKNDIAYVLADESHSGKSAKYVVADITSSGIVWGFVITFSDTTFSQTQMDAINSGATQQKVGAYDSHIANKSNPHEVTYQQLGGTNPSYTKGETDELLDDKQNTISDLATIRSGAALGATALQSVPNTYALKTDLPTKTSDLANDSGFLDDSDTEETDVVFIDDIAIENSGNLITSGAVYKITEAVCDTEIVSGNYNLLKVSDVSFSSRLQDNTAGITASTATNIVTGWIPVQQGKYYAVSALVDGRKDAAAGAGRYFVQRINAKKADGTILVYNKYPTELLTELSRGKAYSVPTDATHMMFHIQIQDRTPQSLDISTSAKLKAFEPMIVEGDTAALAVSNSIDFAYVDGDEEIPGEVAYTLKHDPTKQDKASVSPYYRNVDYHMIPTSYYKGVGTDYDTTFGQNTSYATFIAAWKALVSEHSGYVTETDLGNASDNQKIYLYDFKPIRITNQRTNMPKIVVVAGQHGTEKSNVYGLYYFIDNLLNKWNESSTLEYLRNHVEIMIIPVLNTYGFDNFAYKNANGVNLNRNYDANWALVADTTSDQYGGAAPFDQPETQIVRDLLLDNDDASLVVDFHTNGNGAVAQYSYINYYGVSPNSDAYFNRLIDAVAHQLASISANFNLDYSLNQPDTVFGWLNNANGVGLLRDWATENNFVGVLVEGFNGFPSGTPFIGDVFKANEEIIVNWLVNALGYLKG